MYVYAAFVCNKDVKISAAYVNITHCRIFSFVEYMKSGAAVSEVCNAEIGREPVGNTVYKIGVCAFLRHCCFEPEACSFEHGIVFLYYGF